MKSKAPAASEKTTGTSNSDQTDNTSVAVNFGELLLGTLDLAGHEYTAIGYVDTAAASPSFITGVGTPAEAVAVAAKLPDTADVYFSVNAVRPRPGDTRRGSEADVTRLTALYADLDVKPGGCPTLELARAIAAEVGVILDSAPSAFVESGHGLHPYWVIEDGHLEDGDITAARSLVHRFGRLVAAVAKNHRVAVDGVYDLARMLRVPGTLNNKIGGQAVPVVAYRGTGRPLSMAEVAERLDEVGIEETDEDRVPGTGIVSPPTGWRWAETTCGYVAAMIGGWATDTPTARNPWHYANRIRLECARRNGCITEADYRRAEQILADRLTELVATIAPRRALKRLEIAGAGARAVGVAAAKSDADVARELGWHNHVGTATAEDFWGTSASPAVRRLEPAGDSGTDDGPDVPGTSPPGDSPPPDGRPRLWKATDLEPGEQVRWLASRRLPRGATSLLVGDEGIGKSLLWVWVVAAITTGKPLPEFGIPARAAGHVVLVLTEDDWSATVRPRLEVADADLSKIAVVCERSDGSGAPVFPRDMQLLEQMDPQTVLIVVDAWLDTVPPGLSVRDPQQARQALHPWKELATRADAAVLLLTHTNRVPSPNPRDRYGATGELRKKARMTLFAQTDEGGRLLVGPEKSNLVGPINATAFTIEPVQHFAATEESDGTVPRLVYAGESDRTAKDHLADTADDEPGGNPARRFLTDLLMRNGGELSASDALKAGRAAGFSEQELKDVRRRARKPRIVSRKASFGGGWVWAVDGGSPQGAEDGTEGGVSLGLPPSPPSPPSGATLAVCAACGIPLERPESIAVGRCAECVLTEALGGDG